MKLQLKVRTSAKRLPWRHVQPPGRGLFFSALSRTAPVLGKMLHDAGFGAHRMKPVGYGWPVFPGAKRIPDFLAIGGRGVVEFGSPVPEIMDALARDLMQRDVIDWGGATFHIEDLSVLTPPPFATGRARLRTTTPVIMKGSGKDDSGVRRTREAWLMPGDNPEWRRYFQGNLRRKAETLGLDPQVSLEQVLWIGPKFSVHDVRGIKPGANVEVEVTGAPETLRALWSWGLGQSNSGGYGWIPG